jgi:hypothetical protein
MSTSDNNGPDAVQVIREVEYAIGEEFPTATSRELIDRIDIALATARTEQAERDAQICEAGAALASPDGVIPKSDQEHARLTALSNILTTLAAAIRAGQVSK